MSALVYNRFLEPFEELFAKLGHFVVSEPWFSSGNIKIYFL
jgi:hypothetical protein